MTVLTCISDVQYAAISKQGSRSLLIDLKPIFTAVRQAADLTRRVQQKHLVSSAKDTGDHVEPVTIADYGSQAILCRAIADAYPDDAVLAEEHGSQFGELL